MGVKFTAHKTANVKKPQACSWLPSWSDAPPLAFEIAVTPFGLCVIEADTNLSGEGQNVSSLLMKILTDFDKRVLLLGGLKTANWHIPVGIKTCIIRTYNGETMEDLQSYGLHLRHARYCAVPCAFATGSVNFLITWNHIYSPTLWKVKVRLTRLIKKYGYIQFG